MKDRALHIDDSIAIDLDNEVGELRLENEKLRQIILAYVDPMNVRPDDQSFIDEIIEDNDNAKD